MVATFADDLDNPRKCCVAVQAPVPQRRIFTIVAIISMMILLNSTLRSANLVSQGPVTVEIRGEPGNYRLHRGGEPYVVLGAGTQEVDALESLHRAGGNSIRTWSSDGVGDLLDRAHELDITVSLCLDVKRERHGFDYDDEAAVAAQFDAMREEVLRYRDHPALLTWIIGNELNHEYNNPGVYDAVNDIASMIHELDPHHPTTTTTTADISFELVAVIKERAPDLDFLSVQVYGTLVDMPRVLPHVGWDKAFMITEWGTVGHWEVPTTPWGAPIELDSSRKADNYARGYRDVIRALDGLHIGQYVFLWGYKQERTPTWYGMFLPDGRRTEAIDVLQHAWTGQWPENRAPRIESMTLDGREAGAGVTLAAGDVVTAEVRVRDAERDPLSYEWKLLRESEATQSGGDAEDVPDDISHLIVSQEGHEVRLHAPSKTGACRLFAYIKDTKETGAHANIPFLVSDQE
uniref:Glycoside hydrolase family 2 catalytic domain-containing protein n=1 Tax=Odontella aurita TaxID=265563 RepID=A0A7S4MC30_9STRA|mmetsp:Transcript_17721/g.51588  ORF Transcript_17721/g.51588 Transcript_17721/m.51588 type:complete len:462 (+) Transcript_17721:136-1521(+)